MFKSLERSCKKRRTLPVETLRDRVDAVREHTLTIVRDHLPLIPTNGVIAIEMMQRYELGVVLIANRSGADIEYIVLFAANRVVTLLLASEPKPSSYKKKRVTKSAHIASTPRRWGPVPQDVKSSHVAHLVKLRTDWLTVITRDAPWTASAAEVVQHARCAPSTAAIVTDAEAQARRAYVERARRKQVTKAATIPSKKPTARFRLSSKSCCPAAGCTAKAPSQLCFICAEPLFCRPCDTAMLATINGTGSARLVGNTQRSMAVERGSVDAIYAPDRVAEFSADVARIDAWSKAACKDYAATSAQLCEDMRGSDAPFSPATVHGFQQRRDELEKAPASECADASARARQALHFEGVCWHCLALSDCDDEALPVLHVLSTRCKGLRRPAALALTQMRRDVATLYDGRMAIRAVLDDHVTRLREAATSKMSATFGEGIAPGVAEVIKQCYAETGDSEAIAIDSGHASAIELRESDGTFISTLDDVPSFNGLPPGAAVVHFHSKEPGGVLPSIFSSFGTSPYSATAPSDDEERSAHVAVIDLHGVLVFLFPTIPMVMLDKGRPALAGSNDETASLVSVDDLLEYDNVDAVVFVFVDAFGQTQRVDAFGQTQRGDDAKEPTLIFAAFKHVNAASAATHIAMPEHRVGGPPPREAEKLRAAGTWSDIIKAASHVSAAPPPRGPTTLRGGYGSAINTAMGTPNTEVNYRIGGPNGRGSKADVGVFNVASVMPGRYSDSAALVAERGKRGGGVTQRGGGVTLRKTGALVPRMPAARGSGCAYVGAYPQREQNLRTCDERRSSGGRAFKAGPQISTPSAALARSVDRLNGATPADKLARLCDGQNIAKAATARLAVALDACGIKCLGEVHTDFLDEAFAVSAHLVADSLEDATIALLVRSIAVC